MALCIETSNCVACSLRSGVQAALVFFVVLCSMGFYGSIQNLTFALNDQDDYFVKYTTSVVTCNEVSCTDSSNCILLRLAGEAGDVQKMKLPKMQDYYGYDYTKWILKMVKTYDEDEVLWPKQAKGDASLQQAMEETKVQCAAAEGKGEFPKLILEFDWTKDPANSHWDANTKKRRRKFLIGSVWSLVANTIWLSLCVYLGWAIFGSSDAIEVKQERMASVRNAYLIWFCIDFFFDSAQLAMTWTSKFHGIILATFVSSKVINFVALTYIDNLNDVIQAGGDGSENLSADKIKGKLVNESTPLMDCIAAEQDIGVGEPVKVEDAEGVGDPSP